MPADLDVSEAVEALRAGGVVAFPTETVYGLGADAGDEAALRRIFAAKGRPAWHPLIVHFADVASLDEWARDVPDVARSLAAALWPGPLTLVLRRTERVSRAATAGLETVGLRVPAHPLALELLSAFGGALAAPSANRFGGLSPTTAAAVRAELGPEVPVLDGGPCAVGVESTIVDVSDGVPTILRPGGVPREVIERIVGHDVPSRTGGSVRSPGQLPSHYAPRARVVLASPDDFGGVVEALLAEGVAVGVLCSESAPERTDVSVERLPNDPAGRARRLFEALRRLDASSDVIVAALPYDDGLDWAVRDRLTRAAAPRDAMGAAPPPRAGC